MQIPSTAEPSLEPARTQEKHNKTIQIYYRSKQTHTDNTQETHKQPARNRKYLSKVEGEVVDERHEEEAVELHRHGPREVLPPAEHDVLDQRRHHRRSARRVPRAARFFHQLLEVEVVLTRHTRLTTQKTQTRETI